MRGVEKGQNSILGLYVVIHIAFFVTQLSASYYIYGQTDWIAGTPFRTFVDDAQQSSQDGSGILSWMSSGLAWADKLGDTIKGVVLLEYAFLDEFLSGFAIGARIVGVLLSVAIGISLYSYIPSGKFWLIPGAGVAVLAIIGLVRTDA